MENQGTAKKQYYAQSGDSVAKVLKLLDDGAVVDFVTRPVEAFVRWNDSDVMKLPESARGVYLAAKAQVDRREAAAEDRVDFHKEVTASIERIGDAQRLLSWKSQKSGYEAVCVRPDEVDGLRQKGWKIAGPGEVSGPLPVVGSHYEIKRGSRVDLIVMLKPIEAAKEAFEAGRARAQTYLSNAKEGFKEDMARAGVRVFDPKDAE